MTRVYDAANEQIGELLHGLHRDGHDEIVVGVSHQEYSTEFFIPRALIAAENLAVVRLNVKVPQEAVETVGIERRDYRGAERDKMLTRRIAAIRVGMDRLKHELEATKQDLLAKEAAETSSIVRVPEGQVTPIIEKLAANPEIVEQRQLVWTHIRTLAAEEAHGKQMERAQDLIAGAGINAMERFKDVVGAAKQLNEEDDPELDKAQTEFNRQMVKQTGDLLARSNETSAPTLHGIAETDIRRDVPPSYTPISLPPAPEPPPAPPSKPIVIVQQKPRVRPSRGLSDFGKPKYVLDEE